MAGRGQNRPSTLVGRFDTFAHRDLIAVPGFVHTVKRLWRLRTEAGIDSLSLQELQDGCLDVIRLIIYMLARKGEHALFLYAISREQSLHTDKVQNIVSHNKIL